MTEMGTNGRTPSIRARADTVAGPFRSRCDSADFRDEVRSPTVELPASRRVGLPRAARRSVASLDGTAPR